ncbi:copper-binding protein [Desulfosediminicola sp.]|uniref:copper-binding protein n=2 Tax=Desulfosediminicola TaxID=2886823 RepID=UPI003AF2582D
MQSMTIKAVIAAFAISLISSVAMADKHGSMQGHDSMDHSAMDQSQGKQAEMNHGSMDHGSMDHSSMDHGKMGDTADGDTPAIMGVGVIHQVSKLNRMVNMTHEPIPALNWPEMTMDLPVAKSVDLGSIKAGEQVKFHLELGPDNKYIITDIMK